MKFPIEIKRKLFEAIVPVLCGNNKGTAFFIKDDTLLTARHIFEDYAIDNEEVYIRINNKRIKCQIENIAEEEKTEQTREEESL